MKRTEDKSLYSVVSIHAPWEGCDIFLDLGGNKLILFQFTHPGKGATVHAFGGVFSIGFQFTHPGKGATKAQHTDSRALRVSIHAPWEGCDSAGGAVARPLSSFNSRTLGRVRHLRHLIILLFHLFQFTHPGKGATALSLNSSTIRGSFNSRTLGRVRLG